MFQHTQDSCPSPARAATTPGRGATPPGRATMPARAGHSPATVSSSPAKDRHGLASLKTTWAWKLLDAMHSQLPPQVEVEYVRSLRRMSTLRGATPLHRLSFSPAAVSRASCFKCMTPSYLVATTLRSLTRSCCLLSSTLGSRSS